MKIIARNLIFLPVVLFPTIQSSSAENDDYKEVCSKESCEDLEDIDWEDENFAAQFRQEILADFNLRFVIRNFAKSLIPTAK